MIEIDGSLGEGGGQILRTALSLSVILRKPVKIYNIRKKRRKPGLRPQHLVGLEVLRRISNARVRGNYVGSESIVFHPRTIRPVTLSVNTGTAGSVSLVIQAILPALLFTGGISRIKITGGTDVGMAPTVDYIKRVIFPALHRMGSSPSLAILRRGFMPVGGGSVVLEVPSIGNPLRPLHLTRKERGEMGGILVCGKVSPSLCKRMASVLGEVEVEQHDNVLSSGASITLWKEGYAYGVSGVLKASDSPEGFAHNMKELFEMYKEFPVDSHAADQLVTFLALSKGVSKLLFPKVTGHLRTNLRIIQVFTDINYRIEGSREGYMLTVEGAGLDPEEIAMQER